MPGELDYRAKIEDFERILLELPQVNLRTKHEFCEGLYARTITVPRGVALTGAIHSTENFLLVRSGTIAIWAAHNVVNIYRTGDMLKSQPGHKRAGFAVEETVITTFHANPHNLDDPEQLWEYYTLPDYNALANEITLTLEAEQ